MQDEDISAAAWDSIGTAKLVMQEAYIGFEV